MADPYRPIRDSFPTVSAPRGGITYLPRTDFSGDRPHRGYLVRARDKIAAKVTGWRCRLARWIDPFPPDESWWD